MFGDKFLDAIKKTHEAGTDDDQFGGVITPRSSLGNKCARNTFKDGDSEVNDRVLNNMIPIKAQALNTS